MSMNDIMREVASLTPAEQTRLLQHLMQLRHQRDSGWRDEMAARIDDREPSHWVSANVLKEEFRLPGEK